MFSKNQIEFIQHGNFLLWSAWFQVFQIFSFSFWKASIFQIVYFDLQFEIDNSYKLLFK